MFALLHDRDWLVEQYVTLRRGPTSIAEELGCTAFAVRVAAMWTEYHD
jgi:hypothetical protein